MDAKSSDPTGRGGAVAMVATRQADCGAVRSTQWNGFLLAYRFASGCAFRRRWPTHFLPAGRSWPSSRR